MNFLITGGRSTYTLDLARKLKTAENNLYVADSLSPYLCQSANIFKKTFKIARPSENLALFATDLKALIKSYDIDVLIPTCEEVFYVAAIKDSLPKSCHIFCEALETLMPLHDKYLFANQLSSTAIKAPKTHWFDGNTTETYLKAAFPNGYICKNQFSRFGKNFRINPALKTLQLLHTAENRLLIQSYILGQEFCAYALVKSGKLKGFSAYTNVMTAGKGAGGMFESFSDDRLEIFFHEVINQFAINKGQLAFDFIKTAQNEIYVLECNPRCTSGVHFLKASTLTAVFGQTCIENNRVPSKTQQVVLGSLAYGLWNIKNTPISFIRYGKRVFAAPDVIFSTRDLKPFLYQFYIVIFYTVKALLKGKSAIALTTEDIEYNGQKL